MNRLKSIAELWHSNKANIALGALSLLGIGITAEHVTANWDTLQNNLRSDTAIDFHAVTGEWPSWTPVEVKPLADLTGADISQIEQQGLPTESDFTQNQLGHRPLTDTEATS